MAKKQQAKQVATGTKFIVLRTTPLYSIVNGTVRAFGKNDVLNKGKIIHGHRVSKEFKWRGRRKVGEFIEIEKGGLIFPKSVALFLDAMSSIEGEKKDSRVVKWVLAGIGAFALIMIVRGMNKPQAAAGAPTGAPAPAPTAAV